MTEQMQPKKRGRPQKTTAGPPAEVVQGEAAVALDKILYEAKLPKVTSDEELAQRINEYFKRCVKANRMPTVEEAFLCTGYSPEYLKSVRRGGLNGAKAIFTERAMEIMARTVEIIKAYDARMVMEGKIPQIPYIFRAKNYYNLQDKVEHEFTVNTAPETEMNADEIIKRYSIQQTFPEDEKKEG